MPFNGSVRIILKSSPSGLEIVIAFLSPLSAGSISLSNTFGLSKEYVMLWLNPENSAISLATSSTLSLKDSFPVVASPVGREVGITSYP